ncbi:hypothetical protein DFH28DRAFT_456047 [Melampsora americana]|nr:hypothetical protein DFH28DRAFT_456047 [Melampsora americana]
MYLPILNSISRPVSCCLKFLCSSKSTPSTKIVKTDIIRLPDVPEITFDVYKRTSSSFLTIRAENPLISSEPNLDSNLEDINSSDIVFREFDPNSGRLAGYAVVAGIILFFIIALFVGKMIYNDRRQQNAREQGGPRINVNNGSRTVRSVRFSELPATTFPRESRPLPPGIHPDHVVPVSHPLKPRKGKGISGEAISTPKRMPTREPGKVLQMPLPIMIPKQPVEGSKFISVTPPPGSPISDINISSQLFYEHPVMSPVARQRRVPSLACDRLALLAIANQATEPCKGKGKGKGKGKAAESHPAKTMEGATEKNKEEDAKAKTVEGQSKDPKELIKSTQLSAIIEE